MYLKNPENWLTVSESTATIGDNYFGKTKYESSQFKEQPEAIKTSKWRSQDASAKT